MGRMKHATLELIGDDHDHNHNNSLVRNLNNGTTSSRSVYRRRPCTQPALSNKTRSKIERLISKFGELPVGNVFDFYGKLYGEVLDALDYGYENGLLELLGVMIETLEVYDNGEVLMCKLRVDDSTPNTNECPANLVAVMNKSDLFNEVEKKYFKKNGPVITFPLPPLARVYLRERAINRHNDKASTEVGKLHHLFDLNRDGIPLLELDDKYFKVYNRGVDRSFFNFSCLSEMVNACPEIFYSVEKKSGLHNANVQKQESQTILYDGRFHTHPDLDGNKLDPKDVDDRIEYSLKHRLLQKTLMIAHQSSPNGLPVNIYRETLMCNFDLDIEMIDYLDQITSLTFARILAKAKLIKLKNPKAANDVRICINNEFDYLSWYKELTANA